MGFSQRYIIQNKLGEGGMGTVYRAIDRLNGNRVIALKQLNAYVSRDDLDTEKPENRLLVMSREFFVLAGLRHPNIIRVLEYGFDEANEPFFTMDLLENPRSVVEVSENASFEERVNYFLQLTEGLSYLHRRGIVHRDLKPDNILVGEEGVVKILDFGLAMGDLLRSMQSAEANVITGTFAYMAPEVFQEEPATAKSDLFSLGIVAYEMFTRKHPFLSKNNLAATINAILNKDADYTLLEPQIAHIIAKLLMRSPEERYPSAQLVVHDLAQAYPFLTVIESVTLRENVLQNAPFVGRENEYNQLRQALQSLVETYLMAGSAWLIAGESGVGKSRLLNEIRTVAVTRGVLVLNGQCLSEGGAVHELWRQPLRLLCLQSTPPLEDLSILKPIVPDLESLLDTSIPDAPPALTTKIAQERLLAAIERLFQNAQQPIMLVLEDIHWAGESLNILKRLLPLTVSHPLMMIGSYRDNEAPTLHETLPDMIQLKLKQLSGDEIYRLSEGLLGETKKIQPLVELLQKETQGNALFIIEVIRALAESVGSIDRITSQTIPDFIMSGGMNRILERRIDQVPDEARAFLTMAAVAGRQLDLDLLRMLMPEIPLQHHIQQCVDALVLEAIGDQWRFVHDKLRETTLSGLGDAERQRLHEQVAEAMMILYKTDLTRAPLLLYHWQAAGNLTQSLRYAELSGDQATLNGANLQAKRYYEVAYDCLMQLPTSEASQRQQIQLCVKLSRVAAYHPEESLIQKMRDAVSVAESLNDEALLAQILGSTGAYHFMLGQLSLSMQFFERSMVLAEKLNLEELLLLPYNIIGRTVALAGNFGQSRRKLGDGIRLAEKFKDLELLSGSLAFYALSLMVQGLPAEAESVTARSLDVAEQVGASRLTGTLVINGCGKMWGGHWDEALSFFNRSEALAAKINDFLPLYWSYGFLGNIMMRTGHLNKAAQYLDKAIGMIDKGKTVFHLPLFHAYRAELHFLEGNAELALERTQESLEFGKQTQQELAIGEAYATLGKIYSSLGQLEQAEEAFQQSIASHEHGGRFVQIATVHMDIGKHRAAHNNAEGARQALDTAIQLFVQYKMQWYLQQSRRFRATL